MMISARGRGWHRGECWAGLLPSPHYTRVSSSPSSRQTKRKTVNRRPLAPGWSRAFFWQACNKWWPGDKQEMSALSTSLSQKSVPHSYRVLSWSLTSWSGLWAAALSLLVTIRVPATPKSSVSSKCPVIDKNSTKNDESTKMMTLICHQIVCQQGDI